MLDVIDLDFDYQEVPLLKKVTFNVPEGGLLHVQGANGSGKTTLLKVIAGLYHPLTGQIQFQGHSIALDMTNYQKQICYVGHKSGLNPYLTVRENCFFDTHYGAKNKNITELASIFKLEHHLDYPCGILSAGQKRQVGMLRLWMSDAKLWLLDEPLIALDNEALTILVNHINWHRYQGGAVLLTSHQNLPQSMADYLEYHL